MDTIFAEDALKCMECENNLIMFKAISHLQVSLVLKYVLWFLNCIFFFTHNLSFLYFRRTLTFSSHLPTLKIRKLENKSKSAILLHMKTLDPDTLPSRRLWQLPLWLMIRTERQRLFPQRPAYADWGDNFNAQSRSSGRIWVCGLWKWERWTRRSRSSGLHE